MTSPPSESKRGDEEGLGGKPAGLQNATLMDQGWTGAAGGMERLVGGDKGGRGLLRGLP